MAGFNINTPGGEGKKIIRREPKKTPPETPIAPKDEINKPSDWLYKDIGTERGFAGFGEAAWGLTGTLSAYSSGTFSYTPSSWVGIVNFNINPVRVENIYVNGEGKSEFPRLNRKTGYYHNRFFDVQKYSPSITIIAYNFLSFSRPIYAWPLVPKTIVNENSRVIWPEKISGFYAIPDF